MNTVQASNNQNTSSLGKSAIHASFITSRDVDKMTAADLAAEIQSGRKLSIAGQKLAETRKLLPN